MFPRSVLCRFHRCITTAVGIYLERRCFKGRQPFALGQRTTVRDFGLFKVDGLVTQVITCVELIAYGQAMAVSLTIKCRLLFPCPANIVQDDFINHFGQDVSSALIFIYRP